jgi:glutathione S-transferase
MILIGQYDSPFVRRVAISLRLYQIEFEHRPWSVFKNAHQLAKFNPLQRVPTLVLESGEALVESAAILDYLDERVGPNRALLSRSGDERRKALKICALATGLADKAVALVYERVLHERISTQWVDRCRAQMQSTLDELERDRARWSSSFWFSNRIGHSDIAVACALRFIFEAHQELFDLSVWPSLFVHASQCEALDVFKEISQAFSVQAS